MTIEEALKKINELKELVIKMHSKNLETKEIFKLHDALVHIQIFIENIKQN